MEMLVRIVDKGCGTRFAGDVVTAQADGWMWGSKEVNSEQHRVVRVPVGTPEMVTSMLQVGADNRMVAFRERGIDPSTATFRKVKETPQGFVCELNFDEWKAGFVRVVKEAKVG